MIKCIFNGRNEYVKFEESTDCALRRQRQENEDCSDEGIVPRCYSSVPVIASKRCYSSVPVIASKADGTNFRRLVDSCAIVQNTPQEVIYCYKNCKNAVKLKDGKSYCSLDNVTFKQGKYETVCEEYDPL